MVTTITIGTYPSPPKFSMPLGDPLTPFLSHPLPQVTTDLLSVTIVCIFYHFIPVESYNMYYFSLGFFLKNFFYILDRERLSTSGWGAEKEGDTESEAGSRLWTVSTEPDTGLKLTNCEIMTWAEVRCLANWGTQVPLFCSLNWFSSFLPAQCWLPFSRGPQFPFGKSPVFILYPLVGRVNFGKQLPSWKVKESHPYVCLPFSHSLYGPVWPKLSPSDALS